MDNWGRETLEIGALMTVEEEEEEAWNSVREGHLSFARDSHMESVPHNSLHNRQQLPKAQTSDTFNYFLKKKLKMKWLYIFKKLKRKIIWELKNEPEVVKQFWRQYRLGSRYGHAPIASWLSSAVGNWKIENKWKENHPMELWHLKGAKGSHGMFGTEGFH